ncbi:uncharacterized protein LOC125943542 [Dermacentor silvarum]|uniref:uncharacterized protein LOC125943542 n=1 Tax=Dermacentor silvarum TaxID=543639 RepID=UPI0021008BD3|nr:uncharacterized protein LOC125943542 [Dermacentor silvarum]
MDLGSDHCIIEVVIKVARNKTRTFKFTDWDLFRSNRSERVLTQDTDLDSWCDEIKEDVARAANEQWDELCDSMEGHLKTGKSWRLLRHLLHDGNTKSNQKRALVKAVHLATDSTPDEAVTEQLIDKYLAATDDPMSPQFPEYEGRDAPSMDEDFTVAEVNTGADPSQGEDVLPLPCKEPCRQLNCRQGRLLHNATACGCCPVCVRTLPEGEICRNTEMASIPSGQCGRLLSCVNGRCSWQSQACSQELRKRDLHQGSFDSPYGRPRPDCNDYGEYRPVSCKKGLTCNCVDKDGQRIFGTAIYAQALNMDCSFVHGMFAHLGFPIATRRVSRLFAESSWARPEHRLRCTARGSFEPLQCSDSYCYCLRRDGSLDGRPVRRSSSVHDLKCCASTAQLRGINKSDNATTPPPLLFVIGGRE